MKHILITNSQEFQVRRDSERVLQDILAYGPENMDAFDGSHTFTELYDCRDTLYIALCHQICRCSNLASGRVTNPVSGPIWRSKKHSDGTSYEGYFLLGINEPHGMQITFHLPLSRWPETYFAKTFDEAPPFDGHTPAEVLKRIKSYNE